MCDSRIEFSDILTRLGFKNCYELLSVNSRSLLFPRTKVSCFYVASRSGFSLVGYHCAL